MTTPDWKYLAGQLAGALADVMTQSNVPSFEAPRHRIAWEAAAKQADATLRLYRDTLNCPKEEPKPEAPKHHYVGASSREAKVYHALGWFTDEDFARGIQTYPACHWGLVIKEKYIWRQGQQPDRLRRCHKCWS